MPLDGAERQVEPLADFGVGKPLGDETNLDEGPMCPTSFALKKLTAAEEAKIEAHVKKSVS